MGVRQLTGLDAEFLAMESGAVCGHFGTLTLLERTATGEPLDVLRLRSHVASRLPRVPVFRQRLMGVVLGADQPYWIDDTGFDLDHHVRSAPVPAPGDVAQLADTIARLHAEPLDRSRPLWEAYLLPGLAGGHAAVYFKIHHAVMDGVGSAALLTAMADPRPAAASPLEPWRPEPSPSHLDLLSRVGWSITRQGLRSMRLGVEFLARGPVLAGALLRRSALGGLPAVPDVAEPLPVRAPSTPFNAEISSARSCAFLDMSLRDVKAVGQAAGATVNDVVLALCAGALRRWLTDHGALPGDSLLAAVPVSVRADAEHGTFGNRLSLIRGPLPTQVDNPRERLLAVRTAMATRRRRAGGPSLLADAAEYAPPMVAEAGWRVSAQVMRRLNAWNLIIANVRGPSQPQYFAGARVIGHYPVSVLVHGQGLNVSVFSLEEQLCWGLVADPALVPDLDRLAGFLAEELTLLREASAG